MDVMMVNHMFMQQSKDRNELEKIVEVNNQKNDSTPIEVFTNERISAICIKK